MLGFQHADLNFPSDFHNEETQDLGTSANNNANATTSGTSPTSGWPSCAQHNLNHSSNPVTSTTSKKSESKGSKKSESTNNTTKKKKTRWEPYGYTTYLLITSCTNIIVDVVTTFWLICNCISLFLDLLKDDVHSIPVGGTGTRVRTRSLSGRVCTGRVGSAAAVERVTRSSLVSKSARQVAQTRTTA